MATSPTSPKTSSTIVPTTAGNSFCLPMKLKAIHFKIVTHNAIDSN